MCNAFIFSPVIESGVDITIPIKKIYGVMSAQSNSQRDFLQMIARCRKVEEPVINGYKRQCRTGKGKSYLLDIQRRV